MADEQTTNVSETATTETTQGAVAESTASAESQTQDTGTTQAAGDTTASKVEPTYLGGRFKSAEQLEAYALGLEKAQAATRQTQTTQTTSTTEPPLTLDRIKSNKQYCLNLMAEAQQAGDTAKYQQALTSYDHWNDKLFDARMENEQKRWQGQSAAQFLTNEGNELLKPYQADLVPGNPLNETALNYFGQMKQAIDAGASIDQILLGASVLAAAQKTGKHQAGAKQQATAQFADALNKAAKTAIVTGGGAASKSSSGKPDLSKMSDEDFAKYEAGISEQSKSVPWSRYQRS